MVDRDSWPGMEHLEKGPKSYRIRVKGPVAESWSPRLGGLRITTSEDEADTARHTTLEGPLPDRSALIGVLNTLHDLNVSIESVVQVPPEEG